MRLIGIAICLLITFMPFVYLVTTDIISSKKKNNKEKTTYERQ